MGACESYVRVLKEMLFQVGCRVGSVLTGITRVWSVV